MAFVTGIEFEKKVVTRAGGKTGPRKRNPEQVPWDAEVLRCYESDEPLAVQTSPDPEAVKAIVAALNSAIRYHGLAAREGVPQPGNEPDTVILMWQIYAPKKRGPRNKTSEESAE